MRLEEVNYRVVKSCLIGKENVGRLKYQANALVGCFKC